MHSPLSMAKYSIFSVLFLAVFVLNLYVWKWAILGVLLLVFFLLFFGNALGKIITPYESHAAKTVFGAAGILAILSLYGSLLYYTDLLNETSVAIGLIIIPLVISLFRHKTTQDAIETHEPWHLVPSKTAGAVALALITFLATFSVLFEAQILAPVRSPWLIIPGAFFFGVFLLALIVGAFAMRGKERSITLPVFVGFFFLTVGVAAISYPLGYGFDSFIHQATESHIATFGTITPKPFYYIGQYALVIIAKLGFFIPVGIADKLLVPLLSSLLLPLAAIFSFVHITEVLNKPEHISITNLFHRRRHGMQTAVFAGLAIFFIPLSSFIVTTPQGLANMWTLLVVLASIPLLMKSKHPIPLGTLALFAAAALVTHPLAGIPAALYVTLVAAGPVLKSRGYEAASKTLLPIVFILGSVTLPLVFMLNTAISGLPLKLNLSGLTNLAIFDIFNLSLFFENKFQPFLDLAYLWSWNHTIILIGFVIAAFIIIKRHNLPTSLKIPALAALMMLINYFLMSTIIEFSFLIDYEQGNYADRIFTMMLFFILPFIAITLARLREVTIKSPVSIRAGVTLLVAIILTSTVYLTYPRHDNYTISRGFNVGASDFATVRFINEQAESSDYIVLANQAVSAAAIKEFGFFKYYDDDIFYYPIPTGGEMYQVYLDMVNLGPTRARTLRAMDIAGVNTAYFVVNDYWFLADKLVENAKRTSDDWTAIEDGATHVFTYTR